jgi:hypothetical protein
VARLRWRDRTLIGSGLSRIGVDNGVPAESGEQLALARALSDLTRQLLVNVKTCASTRSQLGWRLYNSLTPLVVGLQSGRIRFGRFAGNP